MAYYFEQEDVQDLKREVSAMQAAEYVGLEMHKRGSVYEMLCPNPEHHDRHLGSCVGMPNKGGRIHCYAGGCDRDFSSLDILLWSGLTYYEAVCALADLSGRGSDFEASKKSNDKKGKKKILSGKEKELLGFRTYPRIKNVNGILGEKPDKGEFLKDRKGDLISYDASGRPWQEMMRDRETLDWMIQGKAIEKMSCTIFSRYQIMLMPDEEFQTQHSISKAEISDALLSLYRDLLRIYMEHGGTELSPQEVLEEAVRKYSAFA